MACGAHLCVAGRPREAWCRDSRGCGCPHLDALCRPRTSVQNGRQVALQRRSDVQVHLTPARHQGGVVRSQQPQNGNQQAPDWREGHELFVETAPWEGTLLVARGELDIASVMALREKLEGASGSARVLLDFAEVTFIDSLSLAAIVAAKRRLDDGGRLAVVADHPYVLLIFEAGGLDSVVEVFRTRDEAEAYLLA